VIASALAGAAGSAKAAEVAVSAGVAAGILTLSAEPSALVLHWSGPGLGSAELPSAVVVDARGSGGGWTIVASTSPLTAPDGTALPSGALSVHSVVVETFAGQQPRNEVAYPVTLPLGTEAPTRIFASATDSGLGQFRLTPRVEVRLPPEDSGPTYSGSVTLSLVSGP
jgi:hypothetical protein